jgi:hypothetical protein
MAIVFANDNGRNTCGPFSCTSSTTVSGLPADQVKLIEAVAAVNPDTVVVLNTAQDIVTQPWINLPSVKSVLEMWNAGEEGGTATARLLLGQADPSGHTTNTWPVNGSDTIYGYDQAKPLYPGDTTGTHPERTDTNDSTDWTQGIYSGYRYYDKEGIPVQFPFGYGLSYTSFRWSGLHVRPSADGGLDVTFTLTNTGRQVGAEVPQVYLGAPADQPSGVQFAVRALAAFDRVTLQPGQSQTVTEHVGLRQLQYWSSAKQQWVLATGPRAVYVGDADAPADLPLQTGIDVQGPAGAGADNVSCVNEQLNATTIDGDLTVPSGAWCDLVDVTVNGSIIANHVAGLRISGSTITRDVIIGNAAAASDPLSSGANDICGTTIGGNLIAHDGARQAPVSIGGCGPVTVGGAVTITGNAATANTVTATTISGDLTCQSNGGVTATQDTVNGRASGQCGSAGAGAKKS